MLCSSWLHPELQGWFNLLKLINVISHINGLQRQKSHDHFNKHRKVLWKKKKTESLHDIRPKKNNVRKNIHQHHKGSVCKPVVNVMLNREESEATV